MQAFSRYLFPISEGQLVTQRGHAILQQANNAGASVHLTSVINVPESLFSSFSNIKQEEFRAYQKECIRAYLDVIYDELSAIYTNIIFKTHVLEGKAFIALIEFSEKHEIDCIVVDALYQNKNPAEKMDSTVKHLMRKSRVPVWSISTHQPKQLRHILAAINVPADSEEGQQLNQRIAWCASQIAVNSGAELTLLHAWQLYGESYLRSHMHYAENDIAKHAAEEKNLRHKQLYILQQNYLSANTKSKIELVKGHPETTIPEYVHENYIDLVVMGTVCRSGIPGFFIGNTAETMLDTLNCSIIAIKPNGFNSPVINPSGV